MNLLPFTQKTLKTGLFLVLFLGSIKAEINLKESVENTEPPAGRIFLKNGDKLKGTAVSLDESLNLNFESDKLTNQVLFPIEEIIALKLDKKTPTPLTKTLARVELNSRYNQPYGDVLIGELKELSPENIVIDTSYADSITIRRSMVKSFKIMNSEPGNFYGPNNIDEWEQTSKKTGWLFQEGSLFSKYHQSIIGKKMALQSSSHISFELSYTQSFKLGLMLFSDSPASMKPNFGCLLELATSSASLSLIGDAQAGNQARRHTNRVSYSIDRTKQSLTFDIFTDAELGVYRIYIDGIQSARLQTNPLEIDNSQGGLSFINNQSTPIKIKKLVVQPWDGHLPTAQNHAELDLAPHNIILNNGDQVPGTVGKVEKDHMIVDTKHAPIKIPLSRIQSFSLESSGEQPIMKQGDVCLWFHNGGHLTLKPSSITKEKITGYGQAFGELEINLSDLSRIDFNIYDDSLKSDRAMAN
ncbi:hypothetical protein OAI07_00310 [Akkermansiaceae bacterium]|nr:hypothetical protein [Akkermansiaceae bacterium]